MAILLNFVISDEPQYLHKKILNIVVMLVGSSSFYISYMLLPHFYMSRILLVFRNFFITLVTIHRALGYHLPQKHR